MAFGLGILRLPPTTFWSMTPRELAAAQAAFAPSMVADRPPSRTELASLLQLFPDHVAVRPPRS